MGSWSVSCGISNIAITSGQECVILPLKEQRSETRKWCVATLPIFGNYDDYGGMENIVSDDNTKLIEEHFGISIGDFVKFLADGKFTYDREEATDVEKKMKHLKEAGEFRFMWIDKKVYNFLSTLTNSNNKGYFDLGTPEMLNLLGFKQIDAEPSDLKNYDPKRFNQLWKKGDVLMYSDGNSMLSINKSFVYHIGKGNNSSIESFIDVPEEIMRLKDRTSMQEWRLVGNKARKDMLYIFGDAYSYMPDNWKYRPDKIDYPINKKYFADMEKFADTIVELINITTNFHPMSGELKPHVLYLTPQCGEYEQHQILLDKFAEINKEITDNRY